MQRFPHELLDRFIDHLSGDNTALATMSLVSRDCHARSAFYLFDTIHIRDDSHFDIFVNAHPYPLFCLYVHSLFLGAPKTRGAHATPRALHVDSDRILQLTSLLPNLDLTHIGIGKVTWMLPRYLHPFPISTPPQPSGSLYAVVEDAHLGGILGSNSSLPRASLILPDATLRPVGPDDNAYVGVRSVAAYQLLHGTLDSGRCLPPLALSQIVARIAGPKTLDGIRVLFERNGSSVTTLSIHWDDASLFGHETNALMTQTGIDRLQVDTLQSLTIWITLGHTAHLGEWHANLAVLGTPAARSIRTLTYGIVVNNSDYIASMDQAKTIPWRHLRPLLEGFPNLRRVTVAICEAKDQPGIGDEVWELLHSCLYPMVSHNVRLNRTTEPVF